MQFGKQQFDMKLAGTQDVEFYSNLQYTGYCSCLLYGESRRRQRRQNNTSHSALLPHLNCSDV